MHGKLEIIEEATSLPVEERVQVVESLLRSLNPPDEVIDEYWRKESLSRLAAVHRGEMATVDGETVFAEIRARYGQ